MMPSCVLHRLRPASRLARTFVRVLTGFCLLGGLSSARAQQNPGGVDPTFNPGAGVHGFEVFSLALQPDGKILIGGSFDAVNGVARTSFARLNADGSLDAGFNPSITNSGNNGAEGQINSVTLRSDGKILIGGVYTSVNGVSRNGPVRLNADGSLDAGYDTTDNVYYVNGIQYAVVPQPDGKVLVGDFGEGIERTNADGSADSGFKPSSGDGSYNAASYGSDPAQVFSIALQPDGKIVFGGHFITFAGVARPGIARLNVDGTLDTAFNPAVSLDQYGAIIGVTVQPDGKILYVGKNYDETTGNSPGIAGRLNADGSVDASFQAGFTADAAVNTAVVQGNGKILLGGRFNTVRGVAHKGFARLNADGSLDPAFDGGIDAADTPNDFVYSIAVQPNAKILLGGAFTSVDGTGLLNVARLLGDHPPFFNGEVGLANAVYYLSFPGGKYFGYYSYLTDPDYIYHFDLGYEYVFDAVDGKAGVYFYDFKSNGFFYTSPVFPFPYLYDFTLGSVLYYYPDPDNAGHYNTDGYRFFYEFKTGQIISK